MNGCKSGGLRGAVPEELPVGAHLYLEVETPNCRLYIPARVLRCRAVEKPIPSNFDHKYQIVCRFIRMSNVTQKRLMRLTLREHLLSSHQKAFVRIRDSIWDAARFSAGSKSRFMA